MNGLSASGLADLAGVTEAEVQRLVDVGVLVARDGAGPFVAADAQKVRLATACEQAEGMRLIARVEKEVWQARFMAPMLESGADQQTAMELAAQPGVDLNLPP
jgi:hypothetical protein